MFLDRGPSTGQATYIATYVFVSASLSVAYDTLAGALFLSYLFLPYDHYDPDCGHLEFELSISL